MDWIFRPFGEIFLAAPGPIGRRLFNSFADNEGGSIANAFTRLQEMNSKDLEPNRHHLHQPSNWGIGPRRHSVERNSRTNHIRDFVDSPKFIVPNSSAVGEMEVSRWANRS